MLRTQLNHLASLVKWLSFVYELSGSGFESSCSHLNFMVHACFEQGVPWHSGNYRVWIHSETRKWHDKNIQSNARTDKCSEHSSIIWPVWSNGWVFVYELSGSEFESGCSDLYNLMMLLWTLTTWKSMIYDFFRRAIDMVFLTEN